MPIHEVVYEVWDLPCIFVGPSHHAIGSKNLINIVHTIDQLHCHYYRSCLKVFKSLLESVLDYTLSHFKNGREVMTHLNNASQCFDCVFLVAHTFSCTLKQHAYVSMMPNIKYTVTSHQFLQWDEVHNNNETYLLEILLVFRNC